MGLKERFRSIFRRTAATSSHIGPRTGAGWDVVYSGQTGAALRVSTAYACVRLLSDSVAALPLRHLRRRGGIFVPDISGTLHTLLSVQPSPAFSAFDFWRIAVREILLSGNAYIVPLVVADRLDRLVLCTRGSVQHDTEADLYHINDPRNGVHGVFGEAEIVHLKWHTGSDAKQGVSVLSHARRSLNIAAAGDAETLRRFSNGGRVRGLVTNDSTVRGMGKFQDAEIMNAATRISRQLNDEGLDLVSVPGDVHVEVLSMNSADMQFLESRKFTVRELCRFFGVHPSFVFDDTSNNYKSAEQANVAFLSHTLNPLLCSIEAELQRKLVPFGAMGRQRLQFDRRSLYACDLDSRVRYQAATIAAGIYTVNDWRAEENMPAVPGGDTVLVSANLRGINELNNNTTPQP